MTMKAHTYYIIFGRPPIGGNFPLPPLAAPLAADEIDLNPVHSYGIHMLPVVFVMIL